MPSNPFTRNGRALVSNVPFQGNIPGSIGQAVTDIGGLDKAIRPGDQVLLKPNFNSADPPPASSDPHFVRAVIQLLFEAGASRVVLGESSMMTLSTRAVLTRTNMLRAAQEAGAEVVCFDEGEWVSQPVKGKYLKNVRVPRALLEAEKLVYACCLKAHRYAGFTMSLKLAVAFMHPQERPWLHLRYLQEKIAELNTLVHPDLIVMDARRCFISGGPAQGEVREPNLILASGDRIALDVEGIRILQSYPETNLKGDPWQFPQIRRAVELGIGARGPEEYEVVGDPSSAT